MKKKKSVLKNYIYNSGYQILALIVPLITTPYVSRVLGADNIGIYEYVHSIAQYFILFGCLGLNLYGQREIAYCGDDKNRRSKVFWELLVLRLVTVGIATLGFLILAQFSGYRIYYYYAVSTLVASMIDISWLFQGREEFRVTVIRNTIVKLLGVVIILVFVRSKDDLWIYFMAHCLTMLIGNLTLWVSFRKFVYKKPTGNLEIVHHLKGTLALFAPQIAVSVYTILDKTMLGYFANTTQVGYYSQSEKIVKIAMTIVTSMGVVMLPRVSRLFAENDKEGIQKSIYRSARFVFFMSLPLIFGLIAISKVFVPVFYGPGYDPVIILLPIISPIIMIIGLSNVVGTQYLVPVKKQKEYTTSIICGSIVNFILNLSLIGSLQAIGVSIATVCSELVVTGVQFYFVRKEFSIKKIINQAWIYIVGSAIMLVVVKTIQQFMPINVWSLSIQIVLGAAVYFAFLLIIKDEFVVTQLHKVTLKIKKTK